MKLTVQSRELIGKKVKKLRKQSRTPGVVYGRHLDDTLRISFDKVQLVKAVEKAGKSTPVELQGEGVDQLVLFHDIQFHPVQDTILHIDCLAVNKDEKVQAEVPVLLIGESLIEKDNIGQVQLIKNTVQVEALPMDLPHDIKIDISVLTEMGQSIHLSDVDLGDKVEAVDDIELTLVTTVAIKEEEVEDEVVEEAVEGGEAEGEEGDAETSDDNESGE